MKREHAAFAARLRAALKHADIEPRPVVLEKLLARHGVVVTAQAISGWLGGRYMPKPAALRALAGLVGLEPYQLQYGARSVREEPAGWSVRPSAADRLAIEEFLALPQAHRALVRELIAALARSGAPRKTR
ncbi:transcriptional regulator [Fulvimonas soli]|jgi:hypothetical protein|uniref:Helix-turn-helix protein n=1 Tax=Fulvimonas soli TaxID=155197 RepID=A0A316IDX3_9GAMM|nr:transcriptional regulator [Fulvimonas soli]PWK88513.1 hypothetical protein C7456_10543 [Fulvimonas soli]TNY26840.1 hypothetical protein BV497_06285 [Fulvimonas soli]